MRGMGPDGNQQGGMGPGGNQQGEMGPGGNQQRGRRPGDNGHHYGHVSNHHRRNHSNRIRPCANRTGVYISPDNNGTAILSNNSIVVNATNAELMTGDNANTMYTMQPIVIQLNGTVIHETTNYVVSDCDDENQPHPGHSGESNSSEESHENELD